MRSLTFSLSPRCPASEWNKIIAKVQATPGINAAERLLPNSTDPDISRIAYATIADDAEVDAILGELRLIDGVEEAEEPEPRYALSP